jgi:hypothetical protein
MKVLGIFVLVLSLLAMPRPDTPGPPIVEAAVPPTSTQAPTPTPTSSPTPRPTATPTPTQTPWPETEAEAVSARYKVQRSLLYLKGINAINEQYAYGLPPLLVVTIIAAETGGDYTLVSSAGAVGPMQVIPKPWYEYSAGDLRTSTWANLIVGMRILRTVIDRYPGDLRFALAVYNCLPENVVADNCGERGGLHYADSVLGYWMPKVLSQYGGSNVAP